MRKLIPGILVALFLSITSVQAQAPGGEAGRIMTPLEAIRLAAEDPAKGITGTFEMTVRGSGRTRMRIYLNSEEDYRDARCLTLDFTRGNAVKIGKSLGLSLRKDLINKRIRVHGTAKRTKIVFRGTGRYYYQTHIYVDDPDQIQLMGGVE